MSAELRGRKIQPDPTAEFGVAPVPCPFPRGLCLVFPPLDTLLPRNCPLARSLLLATRSISNFDAPGHCRGLDFTRRDLDKEVDF